MYPRAALVSVLLAVSMLVTDAARGEYPMRPVRFIVPFPPGGLADVVGRLVANPLSQALGQQVIVDNRPGADGAIAAEITLKAQRDGHTIFMGTNSPMSGVPALRFVPVGSTPAELGDLVKTQLAAWQRAVREAGIPLD